MVDFVLALSHHSNGMTPALENWWILKTIPGREFQVRDYLGAHNFEVYLPVYQARRPRGTRTEVVERPLLPGGYIFSRFNYESRRRDATVSPGLLRSPFLEVGRQFLLDDELRQLRELEARGARPSVRHEGERVSFTWGKCKFEGVIKAICDNGWEVIVETLLIGRRCLFTVLVDRLEAY